MVWQDRGSTKDRGLGNEHAKLRAKLLPLAYGTRCPMCGEIMYEGQQLDLDHVIPRAIAGPDCPDNPRQMTHSSCNRLAGARLGARRRLQNEGKIALDNPLKNSRNWFE